ncbi:MAG: hypothetical protein KatS3mg113_0034 [Planctomycetaceae bacterium]|nr:MAG: hypothetical protein KatS3mg113_0034 [Planctomycetaceae bacterium]
MSSLSDTCDILFQTADPQAGQVLVSCINHPREIVQAAVVQTIVRRAQTDEFLHVLRALPQLSPSVQTWLSAHHHQWHECWLAVWKSRDIQTLRLATAATRSFTPSLALLLLIEQLRERLPFEIREMILNRVYELIDQRVPATSLGAAYHEFTRGEELLQQLADWLQHAAEMPEEAVRDLWECLLLLGEPRHPVVHEILWKAHEDQRVYAAGVMLHSDHPRLARFVVQCLDEKYPHPWAVAAWKQRQDPIYVSTVLRFAAHPHTPNFEENLRQAGPPAWLSKLSELESQLTDTPWLPLIHWCGHLNWPREVSLQVLEWLTRHAPQPDERCAAAEQLLTFDRDQHKQVLVESLQSGETSSEIWAIKHLRWAGLPDVFEHLLAKLQHGSAEVRRAARQELAGFHFDLVWTEADSWSPGQSVAAGRLLLMVDEQWKQRVQRHLSHAAAVHRQRTLFVIKRLQLGRACESLLLAMVNDPVPTVRLALCELLPQLSPATQRILHEQLLQDDHPRVRLEAQRFIPADG